MPRAIGLASLNLTLSVPSVYSVYSVVSLLQDTSRVQSDTRAGRFEPFKEIPIARSFVTNNTGLLAALLKIGYKSVGQAAIGPRNHLQPTDGVVVKG